MTLLLWSFVVVEGKTRKSGENSVVRVRLDASRARLTKRATSLQPHLNYSDTSKSTLKITTKNREANNDKRRHKNLTVSSRMEMLRW
jgi:hypothetical protein